MVTSALEYVKHEVISLKNSVFNEVWLQDRICADPSVLGLGDLALKDRERLQPGGGRLDILLSNSEDETEVWYEVEVMLGATDPSHIIRTIEYWDNERRRYPAYDHVAVIVAEEITARFLHVIGLLAGSIPIIAVQVSSLKIGDQIILNFVKVLDQTELRTDEAETGGLAGEEIDRSAWDRRVGEEQMKVCDRVTQIANEVAKPKVTLKYRKGHVAVCVQGSFFNLITFTPKRGFVPIRFKNVKEIEKWVARLTEAGLDAEITRHGTRLVVRVRGDDLDQNENLLRELIHQAVTSAEL